MIITRELCYKLDEANVKRLGKNAFETERHLLVAIEEQKDRILDEKEEKLHNNTNINTKQQYQQQHQH